MPVNREMFAEIHKLITEFPELHDQYVWEADPEHTGKCGTTRCVAGWAVWLGARDAGLLDRKRQPTDNEIRVALADRLGIDETTYDDDYHFGSYTHTDYAVLAAKLLGLTSAQANSLFHDMDHVRVALRVRSFAEKGEDISAEEWENYM